MRKKNLPPKNNSEENRSQVYPETVERAFNYSLKYLSFRNRSVKEVYDYLLRKNFINETINAVLKKLVDLKFLNDEEFAKQWIESRQKYKSKSKYILKNELRLKGLKNDLIEPLLNEAEDDLKTAKFLFEKKKKTLG